ncbi:hypothetical protein GCM10011529_11840 [Polymorphobacter glacialis]|uniref:DUF4153 domain-containing protein n=1 Tax=Sandarakinorhabdus glacialis TaxID=1614636 RepID=A0A917E722_9SPHN|nr:DUF4153 domain-containing protein [Polymorphobacter glacialis]GGE07088.1 hypothetical protein GCM10011529_11840 [Polymorphobacter glacialis]
MTTPAVPPQIWPLRTWGLALLGAAVGLACNAILPGDLNNPGTTRLAIAVFAIVAALALANVVERTRPLWSAGFAIVAGLIAAGVVLQGGPAFGDDVSVWRLVCAALAIAIATPLFQAWREAQTGLDRNAQPEPPAHFHWHIPYPAAHNRARTNLVLWFTSFAFLGITWLLVFLLAALFHLIGIDALRHLIEQRWFAYMLSGTALGAGIGLLRDRDAILGTLQRVVTTVLAVLAPALAIGLVGFVAALPFTGIEILWSATRSATPIMLGCSIAALVLLNAVTGDAPAEEARSKILRWSALALSATLPVLAVIAAVSTGVRIAQYGVTPDRLWALTFTIIAAAYAAAYFFAPVAGRGNWMALIRRGNLHLGLALCAAALLLATPLIDFGAISAHSQVARLERGSTSAAEFDWRALRYDYGAAGRTALARLAKSPDPAIRKAALSAQASKSRYDLGTASGQIDRRGEIGRNLVVIPATVKMPPALLDLIVGQGLCWNAAVPCVVILEGTASTVLGDAATSQQARRLNLGGDGKWQLDTTGSTDMTARRDPAVDAAIRAGKTEIRDIPQRQLFVDGKPVGPPFR